MAEKKKPQTITIDDKPYKLEDLTEEQKYLILQSQDLNKKANNLKFQLDQVAVSQEVFNKKLKESLMDSVREEINKPI